MMTLQDVLHEAKVLPPEERRELIDLLIDTLPTREIEYPVESFLPPLSGYEVWSPFDSFKAAQQLQELLDAYKRDNCPGVNSIHTPSPGISRETCCCAPCSQ